MVVERFDVSLRGEEPRRQRVWRVASEIENRYQSGWGDQSRTLQLRDWVSRSMVKLSKTALNGSPDVLDFSELL